MKEVKNKYGPGNSVTEYKGRHIDTERPVSVYRNLNSGKCLYSIKQDGLVVGHTSCIMLSDVKFVVQKAGRLKVIETGHKNVHAFAKGVIATRGRMGTTAKDCESSTKGLPANIKYDPYKNDTFVCSNLTNRKFGVTTAMVAVFNKNGVSAAYLNN